jgi:hypothetical protein
MAELREDNSQPYDNVVAMRYSESLPRILRGALEYNSEPRALVLKSTANKKSNLHIDHQVKILDVGPRRLGHSVDGIGQQLIPSASSTWAYGTRY